MENFFQFISQLQQNFCQNQKSFPFNGVTKFIGKWKLLQSFRQIFVDFRLEILLDWEKDWSGIFSKFYTLERKELKRRCKLT